MPAGVKTLGSDVEVLNRGFRSRLGLLVLLVVAALAAATWSGTREHGSGAAEQRQRLLVVSDGDIDYYTLLEKGGFSIEVDSFDDWQAEARELLPDSEAEGVALVLALADERGFGFVVFEAPAQFDYDGLELEPSLDEVEDFAARDYAVLSVGDFAFPHRLSVDQPGDQAFMRVPGFDALEALFGQQAISAREDDDRPTIEELQYEDAIDRARWMYERPATFAASIEFARAAIETSLAQDPHALTLVEPFATGSAVPTPDGGVLLVDHDLEAYSTDAHTLEVHTSEHMRLRYLSAVALDRLFETGELELADCPSLAGGSIEMQRRPRIEASIDGSAISMHTRAGEATVWWKLDEPGCEWRDQATVPSLRGAVLAPQLGPEPGTQRMLMAHVSQNEEQTSKLQVWLRPASASDARSNEQVEQAGRIARVEARDREDSQDSEDLAQAVALLRLYDASIGGLAFVDERHLAMLSRTSAWDDHAIHVVDSLRPGAHLRIPSAFFAEGRELRELAVLSPARLADSVPESGSRFELGPRFAISGVGAGAGAGAELIVLELGGEAWQAFVDGESAPGEITLFTLTPEDLRAEIHSTAGVGAFSVSTQAGALAYSLSSMLLESEIALRTLGGGPEQRLTNNDLPDLLPRFTADGRYLVFVSMLQTSLSPDAFSVPRIVAATSTPGG